MYYYYYVGRSRARQMETKTFSSRERSFVFVGSDHFLRGRATRTCPCSVTNQVENRNHPLPVDVQLFLDWELNEISLLTPDL